MVALRLFLLAACLASAAAINVPACPTPSTKPISCLNGATLNFPGKTGLCFCVCGTTNATASEVDSSNNPLVFAAASNASCTVANCHTNVLACASSAFVQGQGFRKFKDIGLTNPPVPTKKSNGAYCVHNTFNVTQAFVRYMGSPPFMVGATMDAYSMNNAITAAPLTVKANCAATRTNFTLAMSASPPGTVTALVLCNTDLCNKAQPPPRG